MQLDLGRKNANTLYNWVATGVSARAFYIIYCARVKTSMMNGNFEKEIRANLLYITGRMISSKADTY